MSMGLIYSSPLRKSTVFKFLTTTQRMCKMCIDSNSFFSFSLSLFQERRNDIKQKLLPQSNLLLLFSHKYSIRTLLWQNSEKKIVHKKNWFLCKVQKQKFAFMKCVSYRMSSFKTENTPNNRHRALIITEQRCIKLYYQKQQ